MLSDVYIRNLKDGVLTSKTPIKKAVIGVFILLALIALSLFTTTYL